MSSFLAFLKVAPALFSLMLAVWRFVVAAKDRELGRQQQALEAIQAAQAEVLTSLEIRHAAEREHDAHPNDDSGFDLEFKRTD